MGIQDRDYYRRATSGSLWWQGIPPVTRGIIAINVVVFLIQQLSPATSSTLISWFAASAEGTLHHFQFWQLLTATFLHAGLLHILGNMYFFWVVGREIEAVHGSRDFLVFYLSTAILSSLVQVIFQDLRHDPSPMVGASGAVLSVVTVYTLYYPMREMIFMFFIPMPMWMVLLICLFYPLVPGAGAGMGGRIALEAHLAGACYGWLYWWFDLRFSRFWPPGGFRPRLRVFRPTQRESSRFRPSSPNSWTADPAPSPAQSKPPAAVLPSELLDAKLDEILAKIARDGRGSLTEEEQRILEEASRRAQMRRSVRP